MLKKKFFNLSFKNMGKYKKLSLKLIYLEVENHNENAQKLYLASDFTIHSRKIMKHKVQ